MSLYDYFRKVFGPSWPHDRNLGYPEFRNPIWDEKSEEDDDDLLDDEFRFTPNSPFGFHIFSGDLVDIHKYFEQQMDEMLKNFHSTLAGRDLLQLPSGGFHENIKENESGANKYLKPWFEGSIHEDENNLKQDTDIDARANAGDLRNLFPNEDATPSTAQVPGSVFGQSIITRIVRTADGRMEEEKRVRASDGREEISLIRQLGDQKYKVTTKKDAQSGVTDTTEELINLDQGKVDEFNKKWVETKSIDQCKDKRTRMESFYPPDNGTSVTSLFKKWFK